MGCFALWLYEYNFAHFVGKLRVPWESTDAYWKCTAKKVNISCLFFLVLRSKKNKTENKENFVPLLVLKCNGMGSNLVRLVFSAIGKIAAHLRESCLYLILIRKSKETYFITNSYRKVAK